MSLISHIALLAGEVTHRKKIKAWLEERGCEVREMDPSPASGWFSPSRYEVEFVDDAGVVYDGVFEFSHRGILPVTFTVISGTPSKDRPSFWLRKPEFN